MNVLITGGSRGIGWELIKLFSENSYTIYIVSSNKEKLSRLLNETNIQAEVVQVNFLDEGLEQNIEQIFIDWNVKFDIVINNAGLLVNQPFNKSNTQAAINLYKVNYLAPLFICKQILGGYVGQNCHILNIGSMGGVQGSVKFSGLSLYSSTKAALANLTECLAEEYKETTTKINCLALGSAQTEMLEEAFPGYQSQVSAKQMANYIFDFAVNGNKLFNGKIIPVAVTTP